MGLFNTHIRSRQAPDDANVLNFVFAMFSASIGGALKRWAGVTPVDTAGLALVSGTDPVAPAAVTVTAAAYATLFAVNAARLGMAAGHLGATVYLGFNTTFDPDANDGVPWVASTPFPFADCPIPFRGAVYARLKTGAATVSVGTQEW